MTEAQTVVEELTAIFHEHGQMRWMEGAQSKESPTTAHLYRKWGADLADAFKKKILSAIGGQQDQPAQEPVAEIESDRHGQPVLMWKQGGASQLPIGTKLHASPASRSADTEPHGSNKPESSQTPDAPTAPVQPGSKT